ncbi:hypothetical protein AOQ88_01325 [Candidatus Riesia sp. GBBU]|nr:hypothetical protein AOQ88_01325 [Candidatus Riesia sp. GBBU]
MSKNEYYHRYHIQKNFGQHFLINKNLIKKIIDIINPNFNESFIEIGPGFGALTFPLIKRSESLIAVEIDKNLSNHLLNKLRSKRKVKIISEDIMKLDLSILKNRNSMFRIVGNLPYNISTNLIFYFLSFSGFIIDMHFTFQKELAERLFAKPNNKSYSRISVLTQYLYKVVPVIEIDSSSFFPKPKVESLMVKFIPKFPHRDKSNLEVLREITKAAFGKRRKMIKNSLKTFFTVKDFEKIDIDPKDRAENISIKKYFKLVQYFKNR